MTVNLRVRIVICTICYVNLYLDHVHVTRDIWINLINVLYRWNTNRHNEQLVSFNNIYDFHKYY